MTITIPAEESLVGAFPCGGVFFYFGANCPIGKAKSCDVTILEILFSFEWRMIGITN